MTEYVLDPSEGDVYKTTDLDDPSVLERVEVVRPYALGITTKIEAGVVYLRFKNHRGDLVEFDQGLGGVEVTTEALAQARENAAVAVAMAWAYERHLETLADEQDVYETLLAHGFPGDLRTTAEALSMAGLKVAPRAE